ncbi:MAG: hypothetical protein IMY72_01950 [Bacteroidetes bacterium]|nr:hypothetical protein [Bacteroidota bacterium]
MAGNIPEINQKFLLKSKLVTKQKLLKLHASSNHHHNKQSATFGLAQQRI